MRRIFRLSALAMAVAASAACRPETIIQTEDIPTAGIRFVNAVPDTFGLDFRPVDIVENTHFFSVNFRSTTLLYYKNARAGARQFKIFLSNPDLNAPSATQQAIAATVVDEVNLTLEAGKNYTVIIWGYMRPGSTPAKRVTVLEDNPADPGSQIALRIVNAAAGLGAIEGRFYPGTGTAPAAANWPSIAELTASTYINTAAGAVKSNVRLVGSATALLTDPTLPAGIAETIDIDGTPGTTRAGTALTGFVFPRSVAGSRATSFTTPGMFWVWDRRPPRTCALC
ncbi:MAG: DUF4397 domain-containing protein [Gemmatimonadota bacterium]|nr:DUF4397 domain-containing protein [Gemmatimonadota bacterium]